MLAVSEQKVYNICVIFRKRLMECCCMNPYCLREVFGPDVQLKLVTHSKNRGLRLLGNKSLQRGFEWRMTGIDP